MRKRIVVAMSLDRNTLMLISSALVVAIIVLSYLLYEARRQPTGVQINIGPGGVTIETK
jgi:hypothetical protein